MPQAFATPSRLPPGPLTPGADAIRSQMHRANAHVQSVMRTTAVRENEILVDYANVRKRSRESADESSSSFERQYEFARAYARESEEQTFYRQRVQMDQARVRFVAAERTRFEEWEQLADSRAKALAEETVQQSRDRVQAEIIGLYREL